MYGIYYIQSCLRVYRTPWHVPVKRLNLGAHRNTHLRIKIKYIDNKNTCNLKLIFSECPFGLYNGFQPSRCTTIEFFNSFVMNILKNYFESPEQIWTWIAPIQVFSQFYLAFSPNILYYVQIRTLSRPDWCIN